MTTVVEILEVGKTPTEIKDFGFSWARETFRFWRAGAEFGSGIRARPTVANGFEYQSSGGQSSGKKEPRWPTTLGATIVDGSITWTCVALSTDGLWRYIQTSTWTAEDAGIVVDSSAMYNTAGTQASTVKVSGGADGTVRDVVNEVTFNDGVKLQAILRVTIEDEAD